MNNWTARRAKI